MKIFAKQHVLKVDSIADLFASTRSDIFLEKSFIPYLDIPSADPLNAYLYDFFRHGVVKRIEIANGIRRGEIWFLLNDFGYCRDKFGELVDGRANELVCYGESNGKRRCLKW